MIALRVCMVCGQPTAAAETLAAATVGGNARLHVPCAFRLAHDLLDGLQHRQPVSPAASAVAGTLSPRQLAVLEGVVRGERDREIAERLGVAEHTVRNHAYEIQRRLGVRTRSQAAALAVRLSLVPAGDPQAPQAQLGRGAEEAG